MAHPDQQEIEVETDDNDSALGQSIADSTTSLSSSHLNFIWENGRRYHGYKSGQYLYPNDETELDREDVKHHALRLLLDDQLCVTRFESPPLTVLDVGTGTGIWPIEFADARPESRIIAVDLSPVQPHLVPPNLEFQIDDIENIWTFNNQFFDFIHIRNMCSAIRDWQKLLYQAHTALKPGGYIEVSDMDLKYRSDDGTVLPNNPLVEFLNTIHEAALKIGCDLRGMANVPKLLEEAGYINVKVESRKLPLGPWPKDPRLKQIGFLHRHQFMQGLGGIAMGLLTRIMGWTPAAVEVHLIELRQAILNRKIHGYWSVVYVTAQAPT